MIARIMSCSRVHILLLLDLQKGALIVPWDDSTTGLPNKLLETLRRTELLNT